jgi:K+-sensing histidine kinase KdpD
MRHNLNAKRWCSNKSYGYLVAIFGVLAAFSLRYILHPFLEGSLPLFFFQVNTIVIAFYFGIGPAFLTMLISAPLLVIFFIAPYGALSMIEQRDVTTIFVYVSYTLLTSFLVEMLRREQYNAKMAFLVSETRLKLMVEGDQKMRSIMRKSLSKTSTD